MLLVLCRGVAGRMPMGSKSCSTRCKNAELRLNEQTCAALRVKGLLTPAARQPPICHPTHCRQRPRKWRRACSLGPNDGDALLPFRTLGVLCRTPGRGRAVPPYGGGLDRTPLACSMRTPRRASGPRRATGVVVVVASLLAPFVRYLVPRRLRVRSELPVFRRHCAYGAC